MMYAWKPFTSVESLCLFIMYDFKLNLIVVITVSESPNFVPVFFLRKMGLGNV